MPKILKPEIYEKAKKLADEIYKKPSAYKSMYIQKKYKELGGTYANDNTPKNLKRWMQEKRNDVGNKLYPVFRPSVRISKQTPLTVKEIDPRNLKKQIERKQKIKGNTNLPPFKSK